MRNYDSLEDNRAAIVQEVVNNGSSEDWHFATEDEVKLASEIEKCLKRFNIGFVDAKKGKWGYRLNGTRHFTSFKFLQVMKEKVGSLADMVRK